MRKESCKRDPAHEGMWDTSSYKCEQRRICVKRDVYMRKESCKRDPTQEGMWDTSTYTCEKRRIYVERDL